MTLLELEAEVKHAQAVLDRKSLDEIDRYHGIEGVRRLCRAVIRMEQIIRKFANDALKKLEE